VAAPTLSALERQNPKSARIPSIDGLPTSVENDQFDPKPALCFRIGQNQGRIHVFSPGQNSGIEL
jgi:hypothetical protein